MGFKVTVSVVFRCGCDAPTLGLINAFDGMVAWWLEKAASEKPSSVQDLRGGYDEARAKWDCLNSQHIETSCGLGYTLFSSGVKRKVMRFAVLSPATVAIRDGNLRVSIGPKRFGVVSLAASGRVEKNVLSLAEEGICKLGQVVLAEDWAIVPFIFDVDVGYEKFFLPRSLFRDAKKTEE